LSWLLAFASDGARSSKDRGYSCANLSEQQ
jgi:hypothetical protein